MKSSFDQYECKSCYKENESQDHIYECSEIWKIRNENKNEQENYNNIYVGNTNQKLKVARIFEQNLKLYNEMFNKWKKKKGNLSKNCTNPVIGPGDK